MNKYYILIAALVLSIGQVKSQAYGNAYYLNRVDFSNSNVPVLTPNNQMPNDDDIYIKVQGLANVKTDAYVAIFNVSQMAETVEQVNSLIDKRINESLDLINAIAQTETYIDMISFVPVYEIETVKKKFKKDTYNEIPAGFELKKNIHIKFTDPNMLNSIVSILSKHEIYDMVRVDYFSEELSAVKKQMMEKAKLLLKEKVAFHEEIMNEKLDTNIRQMTDGFFVSLPAENYKSYQSYCSSQLSLKKSVDVNQATMSKTHYYQPIVDKDFDFVMNPAILEPVIQVSYTIQLKVTVDREPVIVEKVIEKEVKSVENKFILVTPEGNLKSIN